MRKRKSKKNRKKLKWFLLSALVVTLVVVLVTAGYILYEFKFKTYDIADDQVDAILDDGYTLTLPDGTTVQVGADGKILNETVSGKFKLENEDANVLVEDNRIVKVINANGEEINHPTLKPNLTVEKNDNKIVVTTENGDKVTIVPSNPDETSPEQKPTVASIKQKYESSFEALQSQAESKLFGLVGRAQGEYSSKKENGESISFAYFYNKYMEAASGMEASTDAAFESLIAVLEKDLESNGYNKSYSSSFRSDYETTKESLRSELYKKAISMK